MHHIGTITKTDLMRPFHAQCSCGTAGDFFEEDTARSYLQEHFAKQGGISTSELKESIQKPVVPTPHIGGVGTMPQSHAAAGPPPPPPPPPSSKDDSST
jgi:hypothetical protein